MKVLVYTPLHPAYGVKPQTADAVRAMLAATTHDALWWMDVGARLDLSDGRHRYENIVANYNKARAVALDEGYDALMTLEADMLPPPDAIDRLVAAGGDIAYGLYVFRFSQQWSAFKRLGLFRAHSYSKYAPDEARAAWGSVMDVNGLGNGCTLIRRRALEAFEFRIYDGRDDWIKVKYRPVARRHRIDLDRPRPGMVAPDWMMALDAQQYGLRQVCDTACICGHIDGEIVYWPDPAAGELYREAPLTTARGDR